MMNNLGTRARYSLRPKLNLRFHAVDNQAKMLPEIIATRARILAYNQQQEEDFTVQDQEQKIFEFDVAEIIEAREHTHGAYSLASHWADNIQRELQKLPNWWKMSPPQRVSLQMIVIKMSRIGHGDTNLPDHWEDIAGYAHLAKS